MRSPAPSAPAHPTTPCRTVPEREGSTMRSWLLSLAAVALCACATPPRHQPPPQPVPAAWRDTAVVRTASIAETPWWRIYRDTTLARLVRTALAQNTDLGIALERVTEARALLAQAQGARLPS